eukprot:snap_masked-scaffold_4-processed-gene-11.26-mRNA-1 protein AED:1.00 eAED:1.00 QI:0/-1/0/0/-1/1/1/0/66
MKIIYCKINNKEYYLNRNFVQAVKLTLTRREMRKITQILTDQWHFGYNAEVETNFYIKQYKKNQKK